MSTVQTALLIILAVAIAVVAVLLYRARLLPWPSIGLAAFTSAVCFTVGGDTGQDLPGPDVATVMGGVVGFLCVVSAILALIPRDPARAKPTRLPVVLSTVGIVAAALGLIFTLVTG